MDILSSILSIKKHDEALKLVYKGEELSPSEVLEKTQLKLGFENFLEREQEMLKRAFGEKAQVFDPKKGLKYFNYAFPLIFISSLIHNNTLNLDSLDNENNLNGVLEDVKELQPNQA